jgi:FdhD protein
MILSEKHPGLQVQGGRVAPVQDEVCIEDTFRLLLNDLPLAQIIASPDQLRELGAGFVVCEGLADSVQDVQVHGNEIRVSARTHGKIDYELRSSGCIGVRGMPKIVHSSLVIDQRDVFHVIKHTESEVWKKTGGVHCSVLLKDGEVVAQSSDIGRHSTVDKVVGFAVLNHIDLSHCVLGCTGRQPAGMISKVANAGIPIVVSKAAPTDAGILLADRSSVTLVCFARDDRFTVYAHPQRIRGLTKLPG